MTRKLWKCKCKNDHRVQNQKCCFVITAITTNEQILRLIATSMKMLGPSGMFYLAAAVSDFYVPWESMVIFIIHKF